MSRVVSNAVQEALKTGIPTQTISLTGPDVPVTPSSWARHKHWSPSSEFLPNLLESIQVLQLGQCQLPRELASRRLTSLRQLDLCTVEVDYTALKAFCHSNHSITSIRFHSVSVSGWKEQEGHVLRLTLEPLCDVMDVWSGPVIKSAIWPTDRLIDQKKANLVNFHSTLWINQDLVN